MLLKDLLMEYVFNCQCRKLSEKTVDNYRKQIEYLLRYLETEHHITMLEDVEARHIKGFLMQKTNAGRKPQYVNDLLKAYKCYFKYAYEEQYTDKLITERIRNLRQPKVIIKTFTNIEIKKMIDYYNGFDFLTLRNKTILCMLFDTGMRLNEILTLQDIQLKQDFILVHGKGNKERVVPKSPFLAKMLFKYMNARNGYFQYRVLPPNVFVSRRAKPLTHEMIERVVKDAGAFAKVSKDVRVSPHTCRHTYAQIQLRNGLDLYTLSRLMGHESIAITQRYLEGIKDREVVAAAMKTSPLMNL